MNAVDDFGNVFLVVEIGEFKVEDIWESDLADEFEESDNVVGVTVLQLLVCEDSGDKGGSEHLGELGEGDTIPKIVL